MIVKLPIILSKKYDEDAKKVIIEKGELPVEIDTSFKAHLKWEEQFSQSMGGIDLQTYTESILKNVRSDGLKKAHLISTLKFLYCHINSDQLPTFKDFIALFDMEVAEEVLKKIIDVLDQVAKSASKN